jgi:hypothetical protein
MAISDRPGLKCRAASKRERCPSEIEARHHSLPHCADKGGEPYGRFQKLIAL